ncbi:MAG: DUF4476 domain-containing protein [Bacteroidia bacterium]|nr:DUF4476 domain-containing protein [Bacteroidia bacterium]
MKNLISTLVVSTLFAVSVNADHRLSDLRLRTYDKRPVSVSLNERLYQSAGNALLIEAIQPGRHHLKVWTFRHHPHHYMGERVLLYNGIIDVPASSEVRAMITRDRRLRINEIIPLFAPAPFDPYYGPYPVPAPVPAPGPWGTLPLCMQDAEFDALLSTLQQQGFESTRMTIARQAIRQHGAVSTAQVADLMNLMSFESSRLELAKFAYAYCIDPGRYFQLYNEFSFDSSVQELSAYIDRHS